jgi:hypothetical protein
MRRTYWVVRSGYAVSQVQGKHMIGLFLMLCLGAAVTIVVAWLCVQILLWIQE